MSDIGSSVGGNRGRSPEDRLHDPLYLEQLQRMREQSEPNKEDVHNPASKLFHWAAALLNLKKFIQECSKSAVSSGLSFNNQKVQEDLAGFKKILDELAHIDKSHDPQFTQRLSVAWQKIYEQYESLEEARGSSDPLSNKILHFVDEIAHYPPGEDHTLGYYLTEHAGEDWIPFPFMNLLAELHEEYKNTPSSSHLQSWIRELAEIAGEGI